MTKIKTTANRWGGGDFDGTQGVARWTRRAGDEQRTVLAMTTNGVCKWQIAIPDGVPEAIFTAAIGAAIKAVR